MNKRLEDLTKQDWDTLFPIAFEPHNPVWKSIFEREKQQILEKIADKLLAIEHVGSTAIPDIQSKPNIDISIEIPEASLFDAEIIQSMADMNYHFFRQSGDHSDYMVFVKGYDLNGKKEQVYHVHMCPPGHEMLNQILFRDYLINHPERAREYEQLKKELAVTYKNDRVGYRLAKNDFVRETLVLSANNKG